MSDIQGNHYCKYAEGDETTYKIFCKLVKGIQGCGGVEEDCTLDKPKEYSPDNPDHERS